MADFRYPAETTAERLAFCDMLEMWEAVSSGEMRQSDTPDFALRVASERDIDDMTLLAGYMRRAKAINAWYAGLSDS